MHLHPEVRAWLEVERTVRRARVLAQVVAIALAIVPALFARGAAHRAFAGIEPHLAAAFELVAWATPLIAAAWLGRLAVHRWTLGGGRRWIARVAARHGVAPASIAGALEAG